MKKFAPALFLLFVFGLNLYAGDPTERFRLPFRVINNLIVVKAMVNTSGDRNFILDSGVSASLIFEMEKGDSLNMKMTRPIVINGMGEGRPINATVSFGNTLQMGKLTFENHALVKLEEQLTGLSERMGVRIHGVLSLGLLSPRYVYINYDRSYLEIWNPDAFRLRRRHRRMATMPFEMIRGKPFVRIKGYYTDSASRDLKMLIDTGASHSAWLTPSGQEHLIPGPRTDTLLLGAGLSGKVMGYMTRIQKFEIARYSLRDPLIAFPTKESYSGNYKYLSRDGSLGSEFFRRFHVLFDFVNMKLYLKPNRQFKDEFRFNASGFEVLMPIMNLPYYVVGKVSKGSPAENVGLQEGDHLLQANGRNLFHMEFGEVIKLIEHAHGSKLRLVVSRNGSKHKFVFRIEGGL
ncbi:MAG: aspartyl protease family protein [Cytophagales bacterium]|nr:aspartyl protease family protein [Cytophagales bacterium]